MSRKIKIFSLGLYAGLLSITAAGNGPDHPEPGSEASAFFADTVQKKTLIAVRPFNLGIIPPSSGVSFYRSGIIYLSHTPDKKRIPSNHISFGSVQAYYSWLKDTVPGGKVVFSGDMKFDYPCEAVTFNKDYTVMYFTGKIRKKGPEQIFEARLTNNRQGENIWSSDLKPLSFCDGRSIYTHPSLSGDGRFMVFASDLPGSAGGLDLYVSRMEGESWSLPEHLGNSINTVGNEHFPFLDAENNLYFSSDGLDGSGGYDIFVSRFNSNNWDKPENQGSCINTEHDDIAFSLDKTDNKIAFYTSRKRTGKNGGQLKLVTLKDRPSAESIHRLSETLLYLASGHTAVEEYISPEQLAAETVAASGTDSLLTPLTEAATTAPPLSKSPGKTPPDASVEKEKTVAPGTTSPPGPKLPERDTETTGDVVIYRVQFTTNDNPVGSYSVTAGGQTYKTYEYLYAGAYRSCAGEFSSVGPARALQKIMRQEGYPDAFVVAFKNDERSLDPALFR